MSWESQESVWSGVTSRGILFWPSFPPPPPPPPNVDRYTKETWKPLYWKLVEKRMGYTCMSLKIYLDFDSSSRFVFYLALLGQGLSVLSTLCHSRTILLLLAQNLSACHSFTTDLGQAIQTRWTVTYRFAIPDRVPFVLQLRRIKQFTPTGRSLGSVKIACCSWHLGLL